MNFESDKKTVYYANDDTYNRMSQTSNSVWCLWHLFTYQSRTGNAKVERHRFRNKLDVLQAMKVRAHNGVVTLNLLGEKHLIHHILVLFAGRSWSNIKH